MILKDTILSTVTDRITLLRWLKQVEKALQADTLEDISITQISDTEVKIRLTFADKQFVESPVLTLPRGPQGIAATVEVGTTTTGEAGTPATVVNAGDETHAVFNFTIPRGAKGDKGDKGDKGEGIDIVLNLDFVNSTTVITADEFEKFKNPALVIWGYYQDPDETSTGKLALRMADYSLDNDTGEEVVTFVPAVPSVLITRLNATHTGNTYSYTITGGYIPGGTAINFSIDGIPKTASEAPYHWDAWVNSPEGEGWFIKTNSDGEQIITSDDAEVATFWVSKDEMDNLPVHPTDGIIDRYAYYTYSP